MSLGEGALLAFPIKLEKLTEILNKSGSKVRTVFVLYKADYSTATLTIDTEFELSDKIKTKVESTIPACVEIKFIYQKS